MSISCKPKIPAFNRGHATFPETFRTKRRGVRILHAGRPRKESARLTRTIAFIEEAKTACYVERIFPIKLNRSIFGPHRATCAGIGSFIFNEEVL